jgi:hypothetical protein
VTEKGHQRHWWGFPSGSSLCFGDLLDTCTSRVSWLRLSSSDVGAYELLKTLRTTRKLAGSCHSLVVSRASDLP